VIDVRSVLALARELWDALLAALCPCGGEY